MEIIIDSGIEYIHKVKPIKDYRKGEKYGRKIKELEKQIAELKAELENGRYDTNDKKWSELNWRS